MKIDGTKDEDITIEVEINPRDLQGFMKFLYKALGDGVGYTFLQPCVNMYEALQNANSKKLLKQEKLFEEKKEDGGSTSA